MNPKTQIAVYKSIGVTLAILVGFVIVAFLSIITKGVFVVILFIAGCIAGLFFVVYQYFREE